MYEKLANQAGLSLDRLITLCRVAECGSIGEAAKHYGGGTGTGAANRQALFSRQVDDLEKFFGVDLLNREQKPYRLTAEGEELTRLCRHFLAGLEDYGSSRRSELKRLVIGAGEAFIQWFLMPRWMDSWRDQLRGCAVIFKNVQTQESIDLLQKGELDLIIVRHNAVEKPLRQESIGEFGYLCFMPKHFPHRPAGKSLCLRDLAPYPMAVLEGEGEFHRSLTNGFAKAGVEPRFEMECSSSTQVAKAVEKGNYCAVLPAYAGGQLSGDVVSYTIDDFKVKRRLCYAWNPKRVDYRPVIGEALRVLKREI